MGNGPKEEDSARTPFRKLRKRMAILPIQRICGNAWSASVGAWLPQCLCHGTILKGENTIPVVLHTDDEPALLFCLVVQGLCEGADFRVRQAQGRTIGLLAFCIVVQD